MYRYVRKYQILNQANESCILIIKPTHNWQGLQINPTTAHIRSLLLIWGLWISWKLSVTLFYVRRSSSIKLLNEFNFQIQVFKNHVNLLLNNKQNTLSRRAAYPRDNRLHSNRVDCTSVLGVIHSSICCQWVQHSACHSLNPM